MLTDFKHIAGLHSADAAYRFGNPKTYVTEHELARLILLRSRLGETRADRAAENLSKRDVTRSEPGKSAA